MRAFAEVCFRRGKNTDGDNKVVYFTRDGYRSYYVVRLLSPRREENLKYLTEGSDAVRAEIKTSVYYFYDGGHNSPGHVYKTYAHTADRYENWKKVDKHVKTSPVHIVRAVNTIIIIMHIMYTTRKQPALSAHRF